MRALMVAVLMVGLSAAGARGADSNPVVVMKTSMGTIKIELDREKAPVSTENFIAYVNDKFYDGTIFHRVIPDFMIQGGGFDKEMNQKTTKAPIKNEAGNGRKNTKGTVAMARTSDPNSATAQFFINTKDNAFLDHRDDSVQGYGYAVFGTVVDGMDVVEKISAVPTTTKLPHQNVPVTPVVIESVVVEKK
ncbi:peptidyl-prolyl cis-trans isomerase [bacterium]|nr:peptidyl-prolyl cis-trans isomerase [bacterium]